MYRKGRIYINHLKKKIRGQVLFTLSHFIHLRMWKNLNNVSFSWIPLEIGYNRDLSFLSSRQEYISLPSSH